MSSGCLNNWIALYDAYIKPIKNGSIWVQMNILPWERLWSGLDLYRFFHSHSHRPNHGDPWETIKIRDVPLKTIKITHG